MADHPHKPAQDATLRNYLLACHFIPCWQHVLRCSHKMHSIWTCCGAELKCLAWRKGEGQGAPCKLSRHLKRLWWTPGSCWQRPPACVDGPTQTCPATSRRVFALLTPAPPLLQLSPLLPPQHNAITALPPFPHTNLSGCVADLLFCLPLQALFPLQP